MQPALFLAMALLLSAPGPTNALLAAEAARSGWRAAWRLPALAAAYLVALSGYASFLPALAEAPLLIAGLKWAGAAWLSFLAWRGLRGPADASRETGGGAIFVTTLLNPKPVVVTLMAGPALSPAALLSSIVPAAAAAGALWIAIGVTAGRAGVGRYADRLGALASALFAALLAASAAGVAGA